MSTPREAIQAALSREGAAHIPVVICYPSIFVRDHWRQLTRAPWWYMHSPELAHQLAWREDVIRNTGQDWYEVEPFYSRQERGRLRIHSQIDGIYLQDASDGREWRLNEPIVGGWTPELGRQSIHPAQLADTPDEIDQVIPVSPATDPTDPGTIGRDDLAQQMIARHPDHYPLGYVAAPLWSTYNLWGFEGMMEMIATRPDLVRYACERYLEAAIQSVSEYAWLGAAGIWIEDCMTDMIHPQAFARLNMPNVRLLVEEIRGLGMQSIYYFCGNPAGKWDEILSTGADALALEESKKNFVIDIEEVAERANGHCALLGNLDAIGVLQDGTEDDVRAEIQRQIAAGRHNGSRFVMSIGSPVTPGTPVERVRLYCDLVHDLG